jgi:hypothetical protein
LELSAAPVSGAWRRDPVRCAPSEAAGSWWL